MIGTQSWLLRDRQRRTVGLKGRLVAPLFCSGSSLGRTGQKLLSVFCEARITVPDQSGGYSSDFANKTGTLILVESILQSHGQQALFLVVVVFLEPSSDGVDPGFTTVFWSETLAVSV